MDENWAQAVLSFWFKELKPEQWFQPDADLDLRIANRFHELYLRLKASVPGAARTDPTAALGAIIVLDQFPRNMFRGKPEAFATDVAASALARNAIERGMDAQLGRDERRFLYMPLMHSESLDDQEECVRLFQLLDEPNSLKYAIEHRDIIARFGRFPHRNRVLGRRSSDEELAYLESANTFGQ
jgi:uncharacterized protein (DUF924 family)